MPARTMNLGATADRRRWLGLGLCAVAFGPQALAFEHARHRVMIVSSYSRDYLWSKSTQRGVNAAMLKLGYLDNEAQGQALIQNDQVESKRAVVRKVWMDTKRKNSRGELAVTTRRVMDEIGRFNPDLLLLGDDNAANYIGNQVLGSKTPAVFWGVNGLPLKYGLIENLDTPGRNITGVWQSGYHKESLELLRRLVPKARTFSILACDSETSRPNVKIIEQLARRDVLPLKLQSTIVTNSLADFKRRALAEAQQVDAFFVLNHDTLRDEQGRHVELLDVGRWYLQNIRIPEASHEDQFVYEGMLLTANDSGYNQGFMAFEMADLILQKRGTPARMAVRTPDRGPYLVNRIRADQLGISLNEVMFMIDEVVTQSAALGRVR